MQHKAKQIFGRTLILTAVTLSTCFYASASTLPAIYTQMDNTAANMQREALGQNLSSRYSSRLGNTLTRLRKALENAPALAARVVIGGSSFVDGNDGSVQLVDTLSYVINNDLLYAIPAAAQENLVSELQAISERADDDGLAEDAAALLQAFADVDSTALLANPNYRRKDNPAVRKAWKQRYAQSYSAHRAKRKNKMNNPYAALGERSDRTTNARPSRTAVGTKDTETYLNDRQRNDRSKSRKVEEQKKLKDAYAYGDMARPYATLKTGKMDDAGNTVSGAALAVTAARATKNENLAIAAGKLLRTGSLAGDTRTAAQADEDDFMPLSNAEWAAREKKQAEWSGKASAVTSTTPVSSGGSSKRTPPPPPPGPHKKAPPPPPRPRTLSEVAGSESSSSTPAPSASAAPVILLGDSAPAASKPSVTTLALSSSVKANDSDDGEAYAALGLTKGATREQVTAAYRKLALKRHPDKGGDRNEFDAIQKAYDKLTK